MLALQTLLDVVIVDLIADQNRSNAVRHDKPQLPVADFFVGTKGVKDPVDLQGRPFSGQPSLTNQGQLTLLICLRPQSFDDGQVETANIVDITNSNSRIGLYLRAPERSDGLSFHLESGLGFRPSLKTSPKNTP